ncbi:DUF3298 domain-containing protein [Clostridium bovifaecis]|uniref:DUF3298 domain-containing protein n=1 Tax=Clostridium bovifaecis TaxID=2184719 RepID=A0A6I6EZK3_9CLOT|nr:DUF3298 domain-containing protein [Clostridium bovifaecis]
MDKLKSLKQSYDSIPIPEELGFVVNKAIKESKNKIKKSKATKLAKGAVAALAILTAGVNISPTVAKAMSQVPIIANLVGVITFREYAINEESYNSNLKVPAIQGLNNENLEESLNEKYLEENKKLYEGFKKEVEELKANGGGHLGLDSGYEIKTDNDSILSIGRYTVNTVGSSSTEFEYDTIDKKREILITLPSLFKDDSYVDIISKNIKAQMEEQMKKNSDKAYWIKSKEEDGFEKIDKNQDFYINSNGKLVISFDKYEVAPGYMGVVEFEIPTEVISKGLISSEYIK